MRFILAELSKEVEELKAQLREYTRLLQKRHVKQFELTTESKPQPTFSVWDTAIRIQQSDVRNKPRIHSLSKDSLKTLISKAVDLLINSYGE